jgi:hypothetical protein
MDLGSQTGGVKGEPRTKLDVVDFYWPHRASSAPRSPTPSHLRSISLAFHLLEWLLGSCRVQVKPFTAKSQPAFHAYVDMKRIGGVDDTMELAAIERSLLKLRAQSRGESVPAAAAAPPLAPSGPPQSGQGSACLNPPESERHEAWAMRRNSKTPTNGIPSPS